MIEIAVASIPFAILMYLILKNREPEERFVRNTENDTQDLHEIDVDDAYGTDNESIEDLPQKERNHEIESGHCKTDRENLSSAPSERNDMLVLLVYYYQTIVKIIELIMSKRALRNRRSRRDNYESMLPLSRSSKESDLLSPTVMYEENKSDDTDEEQDLDDEFEMQHQEASIENLEVFIAQRRKLETYLQHYDGKEIDISLSEEAENDESDIVIPPPDTFNTDNERTISDLEKVLLIESEQVALLIDQSPYEESESENITENSLANSFDETLGQIDNEHTPSTNKSLPSQWKLTDNDKISPNEEKQLSTDIMSSFEENKEESNIFEGVVEIEYGEQSVSTKESERSEYDITLKELEYNYDEDSEISDTLINETLNDSSKHSHSSDNEHFDKTNYDLKTDYLCSNEKTIENGDTFEASGIIDEMEKRYMPKKNNAPPIKFEQTEYDENSPQDNNELSTELETQFEEITQESNISESNMKIIDNNIVLESKVIENRIPTTDTDLSEYTKSLKEPVNMKQADSDISEPLIEESQNYNFQSLKTLSSKFLEKSSNGLIREDTCATVTIGGEIDLKVTDGTIDNNDNRIGLDQEFSNETKVEIHENSKESETKIECKTDGKSITISEHKGKSDSDMLSSPIEEIINENLVTENISNNEKSLNIVNSENFSSGVHTVGDNEKLDDVTSRLDINPSPSDQEFENLYKESIDISDENTNEYEETLLNETFNTDGLSKDIDNLSKTSIKKSFRNKAKRRKCNHEAMKKNKVSRNENEDENDDESLINDECSQSDLQNSSSEAETREEVQPMTPVAAVSFDKGRKYGQVSEFILLKEIEQVESLIREAVAENRDLSDSFVESFFNEEKNNSESAGSFQNEIRNLEPIKEETIEDTNNVSNENVDNEKLCLSDDKNNDETSVAITKADSDNDGGKKQDVYDLEEAYAVCEYEEVTEDVYETFCDESDFMVPVIKRDDEWWTTLSDRDASQFETVGDKNKEFNNLECIQKSSETRRKKSAPKKVSFCADEELATIIVDNIDIEYLEEYKDTSLSNTDNYFDVTEIYEESNINNNIKTFFTTEVCDLMMELDTYDDIDMFKNDDIDRVLSSYETLGNLVAVDEYDTQAKQTKHVEEYLADVPEECGREDFQTEAYSRKVDIVCAGGTHIYFDTISTLDECKAFEAEDISSDEYSKYISYTAVEGDYLEVGFIDHSNIDECSAFEASEECDFMVPRTVDSIDNEYSLICIVDESEEIVHKPSAQDTFLDESFFVSHNIDQLNHPGIYQTPSIDEKNKEMKQVGEINLSETTSNMSETVDKIVNSIVNEISYDGCLSNHEDEIEEKLYISSFGDRVEVLGTELEIEVENRISNFDKDITQFDKCKAFPVTAEPFVIEDAVVSKIKELECQMKAIESCLNSPNNTDYPKISTDQTDMSSTSPIFDGEIQNLSYSPITISEYEYIPIVSHEGCSEDMKNEADFQLSESDISQSNDNKWKTHHTEDIHLFQTQPGEIVLDQYAVTNFNEEINMNEKRENDNKIANNSLAKIDQCTAFKAEEFDMDSTLIDSEESTYLPIVKYINNVSALEFSTQLMIDPTPLSDVDTAYTILDSNLPQSNIDQCKAFHAESNCVETVSDKTKLLPVEECDVILVKQPAEYIPDLCPFVQYSLNQCRDIYADEIQLCTAQLKEERNVYIPVSYEQPREDTANKNNFESPIFSHSKIDQCQAFHSDTSEFENSLVPPTIPSINMSINLPVLTLSKEESDYTLSVRLEKFKSLEVLQAASISQDEGSYKVSYE